MEKKIRVKGASQKVNSADGALNLKTVKKTNNTGLKKKYLKIKNICRVTFRLPKKATQHAKKVCVVGDFNGWNKDITNMKIQKSGDFTATIDLKPGQEYQFRYLIDDSIWENDWKADKYVPTPYGHENSVVVS